jgi:hypothetical protein
MTDTLTAALSLMSAAAGPEASEAAMRPDDADWWRLCREADRRAAARPADAKTLRASHLLADDISYDCAYGEIMRDRPAPEAMVDALVFSLRRGAGELTNPAAQVAAGSARRRATQTSVPPRSELQTRNCTAMVARRGGRIDCRKGALP